jgi:hypothetical protein
MLYSTYPGVGIVAGITLPPILFIPYLHGDSYSQVIIIALWRAEQVAAGYVVSFRGLSARKTDSTLSVSLRLSWSTPSFFRIMHACDISIAWLQRWTSWLSYVGWFLERILVPS